MRKETVDLVVHLVSGLGERNFQYSCTSVSVEFQKTGFILCMHAKKFSQCLKNDRFKKLNAKIDFENDTHFHSVIFTINQRRRPVAWR